MLIKSKIGNLDSITAADKQIDWLCLEWYETNKRILRKKTKSGRDISLKFMNENPELTQGDVLFEDEQIIIAVEVLSCDCLVIYPKDMKDMASICYEIGNKHLPLFFEDNSLLVPFEQPLFRLLTAQGYEVKQDKRKLLYPLKTTVSPHGHSNESLFSKIMKMTSSNE
jgi:urease accessory protein